MPFEALANLLFSSYDTVDGVEKVPANEVVKIFNAWFDAGQPVPEDWTWDKVGMSSPIDFLTRHFDPLYVPLIKKCFQSRSMMCLGPYVIPSADICARFFEIENLTAEDQALLLPDLFCNCPLDYTGKFFFDIINSCRTLQPHLFVWFTKQQRQFNINYCDHQGNTALHKALLSKNYAKARLLLSFGADIDIPNQHGMTSKQIIDNKIKPRQKLLESFQTSFDEKEIPLVSEENFKKEIAAFSQQHQTDIPSLFSAANFDPDFHLPSEIFLTNPAIYTYLARSDFTMTSEEFPVYSEEEKSIYAAISQNSSLYSGIYHFPYRTENIMFEESKEGKYAYELFYKTGTDPRIEKMRVKTIREQLEPDQPIYLLYIRDIYTFGVAIEKMTKRPNLRSTKAGFTFVVSAVPKDNHIVTILSVINVQKNVAIYHVLLNSGGSSDSYLQFLSDGIEEGKKWVHAAKFAEESKPAVTPLIEASLGVQDASGNDLNCGIYTLVFCEALLMALQKDNKLQQLLQRAKAPSEEEIVPALHRAIKLRTPQFFKRNDDGTYTAKPHEMLKGYFFQQRWDIGRFYFLEQVKQTRAGLEKQKQDVNDIMQASNGLKPVLLSRAKHSILFKEEDKKADKRNTCFSFVSSCSIM